MERNRFMYSPQWGVYFGKILILIGMVLVFGGLGFLLGNMLCKLFLGVDLSAVNMTAIKKVDTNIILSLKIIQTLGGGIGLFLLPSLLFPKVINYKVNAMVMHTFKPKPWVLLSAVLLVFCSVPFISWLYQLNQQLTFPAAWKELEANIRAMEDQAGALTKLFVAADNIPVLLLNLFVVALVPAVCEEFFFRGIILQYTRFIFDVEWLAIVVSALVFSGFHGQFYGFLPRFALGIILGYFFLKSANIWGCVFLHFLNNALAVLVSYFAKDLSGLRIFDESYQFDWYWVILSLAITVYLLIWVKKKLIRSLYYQFKPKS